jgi:hypothetical protein
VEVSGVIVAEGPTTAVSPEMATAIPKLSKGSASLALSLACCTQLPFGWRTNTYATPGPALFWTLCVAPAMAVSPEIATLAPRPSSAMPSAARSFASWAGVSAAAGAALTASPMLATQAKRERGEPEQHGDMCVISL